MPPSVAALSASRDPEAKRHFAKSARDFVNRASRLPGLPLFGAGAAAAILITTLSGAFGTDGLPLPQRLLFWALIIGSNTLLWICWFAWRVRGNGDWWRAALGGALILNLPIPAEIGLALRLVGADTPTDWHFTLLHAGGISAALLLLVATGLRGLHSRIVSPERKGRLWRAGFREPATIAAISSEDHYCRIWLADGSSRLIYGRFTDLVEELEGIDGAVVRRGQWVAASTINAIRREGRGWSLLLEDGRTVRVASSTVPALRKLGWLAKHGAAQSVA